MSASLGLQLYSLRNELPSDYAGIIKRVADAGYAGVEPAGFPGSSLEEVGRIYNDLGLAVPSIHVPLPIGEKRQESIDTALTLGASRVVSGLGPDNFTSVELIIESCNHFNDAAENARDDGMAFAIHNHWWEFEVLDGRPVYQYMLEHLEPFVEFEIDTYWVKTAGMDPAPIIEELGPRCPLLHIKDGPCVQKEPQTAVGEGAMNFEPIMKAARHTEWMIVELDACATDMVEAVEKSARFMRDKGYVG